MSMVDFPVWRTVLLGTHRTKVGLVEAFVSEGHQLSNYAANNIVANPKFGVVGPQKLDLYKATVERITGNVRSTFGETFAKLESSGFGKCPHETALQLRRVYLDQPLNEWLTVISEPLVGSSGNPSILYIEHASDGSWVHSRCARADVELRGDTMLVFLRQ